MSALHVLGVVIPVLWSLLALAYSIRVIRVNHANVLDQSRHHLPIQRRVRQAGSARVEIAANKRDEVFDWTTLESWFDTAYVPIPPRESFLILPKKSSWALTAKTERSVTVSDQGFKLVATDNENGLMELRIEVDLEYQGNRQLKSQPGNPYVIKLDLQAAEEQPAQFLIILTPNERVLTSTILLQSAGPLPKLRPLTLVPLSEIAAADTEAVAESVRRATRAEEQLWLTASANETLPPWLREAIRRARQAWNSEA